eukprot:Nk52_evm21s2426 gene=Nk52_evmTU21s2426
MVGQESGLIEKSLGAGDIMEIHNVLHSFFHLVDTYGQLCLAMEQYESPISGSIQEKIQSKMHKVLEEFAVLFTTTGPAAVFDFPQRGLRKEGYGAEMGKLCEVMGTKFKGFSHVEHNVVLRPFSASLVENQSYWSAYSQEGAMTAIGRHWDVLVREEGAWRMKERRVWLTWTKEQGTMEVPLQFLLQEPL